MCLHKNSKHNASREAYRDIKCYKVLVKLDDGTYITPFTRKAVKLGTIYEDPYNPFLEDKGSIMSGVYHSFVRKCDAIWTIKAFNKYCFPEDKWIWARAVIVRAIIPKGTKFYSGIDSNGLPCRGSYKIKYCNVCE